MPNLDKREKQDAWKIAASAAVEVFNEIRHAPAGSPKGGQFISSSGGTKVGTKVGAKGGVDLGAEVYVRSVHGGKYKKGGDTDAVITKMEKDLKAGGFIEGPVRTRQVFGESIPKAKYRTFTHPQSSIKLEMLDLGDKIGVSWKGTALDRRKRTK